MKERIIAAVVCLMILATMDILKYSGSYIKPLQGKKPCSACKD